MRANSAKLILRRHFRAKAPSERLAKEDMACTLSHLRAMRAFLETSDSAALVLEDDVRVADDLSDVLQGQDWWPLGHGLIKIEAYLTKKLVVLLGPEIGRTPAGRSVRALHSRHTGGAGYLINREAAQVVLQMCPTLDVPIDHLLFNANVSAVARKLRPVQVVPAMVEQRRAELGSDIGGLRRDARPRGVAYWWREAIRGLYEVRRGPSQATQMIIGGARLHSVAFAARPGAVGKHDTR